MAERNASNTSLVIRGLGAIAIQLPLRIFSAAVELVLSRRGLAILFLLGASRLALAGWLRPPLSTDIRGFNIPLGPRDFPAMEEFLTGPRHIPLDSAGGLVLGLVILGLVVVLFSPKRLGWVAGLVLCGSLVALAATAVNHPILIELLDFESEERQYMVRVINQTPAENALANADNTRVRDQVVPLENIWRPDLLRGWMYLHNGKWLVPWAVVGIVLGYAGSFRRRLGMVTVWTLAAVILSLGVCHERLVAEYHWGEASRLQAERDFDGCRREIQEAVAWVPELEHLERTWLLAGKLDCLEHKATPHRVYFTAYQLRRHNERIRALAMLEDLRTTGAQQFRAVRYQAARLFIETGLDYYLEDRLMAAQDAWRKATLLVPGKTACAVGLGLVQCRTDRTNPDLAEAEFTQLLNGLADRPLRADLLNILGHAHLEAVRLTEARRRFAQSGEAFSLPKTINYGAQKGLGGL